VHPGWFQIGCTRSRNNLVSGIDMLWTGSDIVTKMLDRSTIQVDRARCINFTAYAECTRCKAACALGIPSPESGPVMADRFREECDRCGACASECPTGAVELPDDIYSRRLLRLSLQLKQHASAEGPTACKDVVISCGEPAESEAPGVSGGCVSWLDQAAMLRLVADTDANLHIELGACPEAESQRASLCISRLTRYAEDCNILLRLIGAGVKVTLLPNASSRAPRTVTHADLVDRGAAIHETLQRGLTMLSPKRGPHAISQENDSGRLSKISRRFIAAVATKTLIDRVNPEERLSSIDTESSAGPLSRKGPRINKELCATCGVCSLLCPTGALRKRQVECDGAREWRLSLDVRQCVGCAVCVRGCGTPGAMSLVDRGLSGIWREKAIILVRRDCSVCDICGIEFAVKGGPDGAQGSAGQCPACNLKKLRFAGFY